jgi:hypothetical protein
MDLSEPGAALQVALRRLQQTGQALRQQAQQAFVPTFPELQKVMATLIAQAAVRPRHCPAAYVLAWEYYLVDAQKPLSARAVRYLCWEPTVATTAHFQSYLDTEVGELSSRALQGLVWCCHTCWSPELAAGTVVRRVHQRLAMYTGTEGLLVRWRRHADMLLGPAGPRALAAALVTECIPIATFCHAWALDERSPYMLAVLRAALPQCLQLMGEKPALRTYLLTTLLPWSGWPVQDFHTAMAAAILHPVTATTAGMPAQLITLALADERLGDPRLPCQQAHWRTLPQEAQQRMVHWLSQIDIAFFFDEVLPESKDQAERKIFWLRYAPRVLRSRPLLNEVDSVRLAARLGQMPELARHFGRLDGETSACILDFGAVVIVQVSDVSDACYVYGKRNFEQIVLDFWQAPPFILAELLVTKQAATIYHHATWEKDVTEILALCDIQPTYKTPV